MPLRFLYHIRLQPSKTGNRNLPNLMTAAAACVSTFTPSLPLFHRPSFALLRFSNLFLRNPNSTSSSNSIIISGPRDNRQPLRRGRTLSIEAILTVQALKRASHDEETVERIISTSAARLIKADLLAALTELQRQDQWQLALKIFEFARRENWYKTDCALYADMVASLTRSKADFEIDLLMEKLMEELTMGGGIAAGELRGSARLVKALIAAGKGKGVKDVYEMMKRGGCEPNEYLFMFMIKGLRRLGEEVPACEVEKDYELWGFGGFGSEPLTI